MSSIIPTAMLVRCCLFRVGYPLGVIGGFSLSLLAVSVVICLRHEVCLACSCVRGTRRMDGD
jgi:hypothetical protein